MEVRGVKRLLLCVVLRGDGEEVNALCAYIGWGGMQRGLLGAGVFGLVSELMVN